MSEGRQVAVRLIGMLDEMKEYPKNALFFMRKYEVSRSTVFRDIDFLRYRMNKKIITIKGKGWQVIDD